MAKQKTIEPHWNELVKVFFDFTKSRFNEPPSFDGSAPRDLKNIVHSLKKRAEDKGIEWSESVATTRLRLFFEECYMDKWLSENWLLSNMNRQKDKIFFNAAKKVQWLGQ